MSDEPQSPFLWQHCELPPMSEDEKRSFAEVRPPAGYMLHSWAIAPIGTMVICWVRMHTDLGSELALRLLDRSKAK